METLKSYLETMFANMANTEEVRRAKDELWQMMEDKYSELLEEGKSENEAVGTVISEFGNLEELSADLGLEQEYKASEEMTAKRPCRVLTSEEIKAYLHDKKVNAYRMGLGVMFCIVSPTGFMISELLHISSAFGFSLMTAMIVAAVCLFVYSGIVTSKWDFVKKGACAMTYDQTQMIRDEKERYLTSYAIRLTVGIVLCILSVLPIILFSEMNMNIFGGESELVGVILMFVMVGLGVMLIVQNAKVNGSYNTLMKLNNADLVNGNYVPEQKNFHYVNKTVETIMEVYWPTVTCLYLALSFLTFDWHKTWIIWPVAAIISKVVQKNLTVH